MTNAGPLQRLLLESDRTLQLRREYQLPARGALLRILGTDGNNDSHRHIAVVLDLVSIEVAARVMKVNASGRGPRLRAVESPHRFRGQFVGRWRRGCRERPM